MVTPDLQSILPALTGSLRAFGRPPTTPRPPIRQDESDNSLDHRLNVAGAGRGHCRLCRHGPGRIAASTGQRAAARLLPDHAGDPAGPGDEDLYLITFIIAVIVFFLVEGLLLLITFRFRRRKETRAAQADARQQPARDPVDDRARDHRDRPVRGRADHAQRAVPRRDAANPGVIVDVTGFQWQWTFDYESEGISLTGAGHEGPRWPCRSTRPSGSGSTRTRRHPLVLRAAVPLQEGRRSRAASTSSTWSSPTSGTLRRPMRRVLRPRPRRHAVHRPGDEPGRFRRVGGPASVTEPTPRRARSRRARRPSSVSSVSVTEGFDPATLTRPGGSAVVGQPDQRRSGRPPHDFAIRGAQPRRQPTGWAMPDAQGGRSATYQPPPLPAGDYEFYCSIHPNMRGTLTVGREQMATTTLAPRAPPTAGRAWLLRVADDHRSQEDRRDVHHHRVRASSCSAASSRC